MAEGLIGGRRVMLLMPQTYMNDSGQAVGEAQRYLKIPERDIYVLHDEIDLAPGKLKIKAGGGNAGHNGLRSISAHVGNDYARRAKIFFVFNQAAQSPAPVREQRDRAVMVKWTYAVDF